MDFSMSKFFNNMKKKKKELSEADIAAQQEEARRQAIADFNVKNAGRYWIDPDKAPTDEDVADAKKEYEDVTKALNEKNDYVIADSHNALRVAKFMKEFIEHTFWQKRSFVGVLNFSALMKDFIEHFDEENPCDLVLEFGPMQFAYMMFENFGGVGVQSANWMAENWDEYLPIYEKLHELIDWYQGEVRKSESLSTKWTLMSQGYYMNILENVEEKTTDGNDESEETADSSVEAETAE